jgi:DNA polymerase-4
MKMERIIFYIDINSAYLSFEAVYRLQHGVKIDLREIPSAVAGSQATRHEIILAKSSPTKKYGVKTGEAIWEAKKKCPHITLVPPNYALYICCHRAFVELLKQYSDKVQVFSIDECFLDMTGMDIMGEPIEVAYSIKERIKKELGFTVSIGISTNKLLAKMGSELKKPNAITTLFPSEVPEKMWPLPIEELYMVGRATAPKMRKLGIETIGDLARFDLDLLKHTFKSWGVMLWNYANGIEESEVAYGSSGHSIIKGVGVGVGIGEGVGDGVSVGFGVIVGEREGANVFVGSGTKDGTIVSEGLSVLLLSFPSGVSRAGVAVDSGVLVSVAAGLVETGVGSKVAMLLGATGISVTSGAYKASGLKHPAVRNIIAKRMNKSRKNLKLCAS